MAEEGESPIGPSIWQENHDLMRPSTFTGAQPTTGLPARFREVTLAGA